MTESLPFHRLANIFPLIEGREFDELVASIGANGQRDPIILHEGAILDGRNRYRACLAAGVHPKFEILPEEINALRYVIDRNLRRRHMNDDQRRMVAARIANLGKGNPGQMGQNDPLKIGDAAAAVNADKEGTRRAKAVLNHAEPEIQAAVDRGKLTVNCAVQASKLAPERQRSIAKQAEAGKASAVRSVIKQEARAYREADLAEKIAALPEKKYGVIVADPEWRFEPWSRTTGMDRAADNHYPTSCTEVIAARDVPSIAAKDCVLFLWATAPMLPHALAVMAAWGFDYKSHCIWDKNSVGTGYWFRNQHELLLVGTRGKVPAPAPGTQVSSITVIRRGEHSAKPEIFLEDIERQFPTLPKIELNRRGPPRAGWDAWGLEAEPNPPTPEVASHLGVEPAVVVPAQPPDTIAAGSPK